MTQSKTIFDCLHLHMLVHLSDIFFRSLQVNLNKTIVDLFSQLSGLHVFLYLFYFTSVVLKTFEKITEISTS